MSKHTWAGWDVEEFPGQIHWCTRCGLLREMVRRDASSGGGETSRFAAPDPRLEPKDPKSRKPIWRNDAPPCRP